MKNSIKVVAAVLCFSLAGSLGACSKPVETSQSDEVHFETGEPVIESMTPEEYDKAVPTDVQGTEALKITYNGVEVSYPMNLSVFTDDGWVEAKEEDGSFAGWYTNEKYGYDLNLAGFSIPNTTIAVRTSPDVLAKGVYCFAFVAYDENKLDAHPSMTINGYDIFDSNIPAEFASIEADVKDQKDQAAVGKYYSCDYDVNESFGFLQILQVNSTNMNIAFELSSQRPFHDTDGMWVVSGDSDDGKGIDTSE